MQHQLLFVIIFLFYSCSKADYTKTAKPPILKIGLIADPQYANKPNNEVRYCKESLGKLNEAILTFNSSNVDFIQTLGDVIDEDWDSYDSIVPIYKNINPNIKSYHLLGNHDFSIDVKHYKQILEKLSMPDFFYSYSAKNYRFVVLDATDISYYSNSLHKRDINEVHSYYQHTRGSSNHELSNGAIGKEQQKWLLQELDKAKALNQKVILYSHMPLRPIGHSANLWNDSEIIEIIENDTNVLAFINGHNHTGAYVYKNGIHYITVSGMVEKKESTYAILEIYENELKLVGYGGQNDLLLNEQNQN